MRFIRKALFHLAYEQGQILTQHGQLFDAVQYSRFKYGMQKEATSYAHALFEHVFLPIRSWIDTNPQVYLTSSAYKSVPTASDAIANELLSFLQNHFDTSIHKFKIYRNNLFTHDYGTLSEQERHFYMQKVDLCLPQELNLSRQKVIIIDDIRITGAHENRLRELFLKQTQAQEVMFVYLAMFRHKVSPSIEHQLNHAWLDELEKLYLVFNNPHFLPNARLCKFLLSYSDRYKLRLFLERIPIESLHKLQEAIKSDGYAQMSAYQANCSLIQSILETTCLESS
ncbi:MAG: phosphoribosyltransferase family protein [Microscillaceae bacterium]|nr:phosphoribosyltransferase family protein [Microscillaceae bacterium]MDW8461438.1 phosphoribosyltransferase family protein [Cytophagales bacterium]